MYGGTYAIIVMWAELDHCHFLYVPTFLNVVTNGNGVGTKNVLKWNRALGFEFSIQSSVYGAIVQISINFQKTVLTCFIINFQNFNIL